MNEDRQAIWGQFSAPNLAYLAELYERYRSDPASGGPEIRGFFDRWGEPPTTYPAAPTPQPEAALPPAADLVCGAKALATAIRMYGHHAARLDPLGSEPPGDRALLPESHGLREEDLSALPASVIEGPVAVGAASALEANQRLRGIYQGAMGLEFEHISNAEEREWWMEAVESGRYRPPQDPIDGRSLLERLSQVEGFELFLQSAYPTQTRFSLEGLDMLVPMLDELVSDAAAAGTKSMMLGMAHRGRLNVLAHVLGRPYEQILAEFQGAYQRPNISDTDSSDVGWTGDVKYHLGGGRAVPGGREGEMVVSMVPNPSHLEFVDPVVEGMTRAASEYRNERGPARLDEEISLAVLLHGDAAFVGEGVVAETLNLSRLPGYRSGGTLHIIENNQVGFTTLPGLGRSTLFASDLAKGFEIPIVHVNADDPEACIVALRLAHAYLVRFRKDAVVDLIGYRRRGHNEGDDPTFTQPVMYRKIAGHPTVRELWAREMARRGVVPEEEAQRMLREVMERLQAIRRSLPREVAPGGEERFPAGLEAGGTTGGLGHPGVAKEIATAVQADELRRLNEELLALPEGFHLHPKLQPIRSRRRAALTPEEGGERSRIDWAHAESLAFASILAEGTPIRLTGQDTARGTFSQRHAVLHDVETGATYVPLQRLPSARAACGIWDSPLSETATMGFEYGYSLQAPEALVLWEAQYGDFVDAAQTVVDAFVVSARSKWGVSNSLVLLLPHGYEGQGPEHSSARLERFLQMAAEDNMRIANCTTAAQYFHILRRQAKLLALDPRPLVLMTPKSLLRHPLAASALEELSQGRFQPVIDDARARENPDAVRRLVLCSGKVYVDLVTARIETAGGQGPTQTAIVRVEELYPFPAEEIRRIVEGYPGLHEVAWVQEEPRNMGAWTYVAPRLRDLLQDRWPLLYVGRTRRASPAEGAHEWHVREQRRVVQDALLREAPSIG
ncbi:MAG: 2-oxoglutarate dehydrogenase E1 component [Sphingomonadaceae bacterium]